MLLPLLPIVPIIFLILIIMAIVASIFGSQESFYRANFVLPFDTTEYTITSPFGTREDPISSEIKQHNGIDVVPQSSNIVAIADGTVIVSSYDPDSSGEHVIIEHKIDGAIYRSGYLHLKENSRVVNVGDKVKQGQQVGLLGSTGYSTGEHLHLSLQVYNSKKKTFEYTDPLSIIENKIAAKSYDLYDYENNKFHSNFPSLDYNNGYSNGYKNPALNP